MFDRYTLRALRSVYFARESVSQYGSTTLDTEHLLLGILQSDPNVITSLLPSMTTDDLRSEVEKGMAVNAPLPPNIDIPLSAAGEQIHTFALEEADSFGHRRVDIAHLLAGMLREENGVAGQILRAAGLSLEAVRQQLKLGEAETQ